MTSPSDGLQLADWLAGMNLQYYESVFQANDIGVALLPQITADDLRDIGITSVGHRRLLLQAIGKLNEAALPASPSGGEGHVNGIATSAAHAHENSLSLLPSAGAASAAHQPHQHRLLTVMFCDLVGSTELSCTLDAEDLQSLVQTYRECIGAIIQKHKGFIAQYLGDGVLVYFGYPRISESDCERALRAALDTLRAVQSLPAMVGAKLQVRIGIATGMVVIGQLVGAGDTHEVGAIGETPNLAARMQGLASPGGVVVSGATRDAAGDLFEFRSLGPVVVKGLSRSVVAWELLAEQYSQSRFQAMRGRRRLDRLIGRDVELNFLRAQLERSRSGRGQAVLLRGDAGTGKSHLVARLCADTYPGEPSAPVLQCSPDYSLTPLYPCIQYLEAAARYRLDDSDAEKQRKLQALAVYYGLGSDDDFFALAELLGLHTLSAAHMQGVSADVVRSRIQTALLRWLHSLVRERMLVVVEDLHWADPSTKELLGKFVTELPRQNAMLIVTSRPTKDKTLGEGGHVSVLHLDCLPEDDIRVIVAALAAPRAFPENIMRQIVDRAEGVPIFATELARAMLLRDDFGSESSSKSIPSTLSDILLARLDQLQHGALTVQQAAVLGREFEMSLLVACSEDLMEDTQAAIEELLEAHLFVKRTTANGLMLSFDHMLVKDAVYQRMLRADRARLHAKVALVMEQQFAQSTRSAPHLLALHHTEAGNFQSAVLYWERAAELAANQLALHEAVAHYSRALELLVQVTQTGERDEHELRLCMAATGPVIATRGIGSRKLRGLVDRAQLLCTHLPQSEYRVSALYLRWAVALGSWDMADLRPLALEVRDAASSGSEIECLLAHRAMGFTCMIQGQLATAQDEFEAFFRLYSPETHGNSASFRFSSNSHVCSVLLALATTCSLRKLPAVADHWRDQALLYAQRSANHIAVCQAFVFCGGHMSGLWRRPDDMARYAKEARAYATSNQLPIWLPYADLITALSGLMAGRQSDAEVSALLEKAKNCVDILLNQHSAYLTTWVVFYARACLENGRFQDGIEALERIDSRVAAGERWMEPEYLRLKARLNHAKAPGDPVMLESALRQALALAESQGSLIFVADILQDIQSLEPALLESTREPHA